MKPDRVAELIFNTLSGERAKSITEEITQFYRSPGSEGYHAATNLVADRLREAGVADVVSHSYPLDGKTRFLNATMSPAWEPYRAVVRTVSPELGILVDYETAPSCLAWWSQPTPEGGAEYDLIDVGTGAHEQDWAGKDLAGKAVFIHHSDHRSLWQDSATRAMQMGAAGIVTDYLLYQTAPFRTRESLPDAVQLLRLPNAMGKYNTWAVAVDHHAGQRLRSLLAAGPVRIHADVQCRLFEGTGQNLIATIPGRELPDESVFFIAHTSAATRPAANCAAGPALMVEIARTLTELIAQGKLRPPRRSIRFLFVIEGLGSEFYLDTHRDELHKVKAAICLDSVGHDQSKCQSILLYYRHPDSTPSFINDYFASVMERTPKARSWVFGEDNSLSPVQFRQAPYTPWSDNHYWASLGVPSPLIMSWPDKYFHTQLLTADKTDPLVFQEAGVATALAAYEIADAGPVEAGAIADEVASRAWFRLSQIAGRAISRLMHNGHGDTASEVVERAVKELRYAAERDANAVASVLTLVPGDSPDKVPEELRRRIDENRRDLLERAERLARRVGEWLVQPAGD